MPSLAHRPSSRRLLGAIVAAALAVTGVFGAGPALAVSAVPGAIAGVVTDESGQPLTDAWVTVIPADGSSDSTGSWTNASGEYTVTDLPPGGYKVRFEPGAEGLVGEWWDDVTSEAAATVVDVIDGETSQASASLGEAGTIRGIVRDASGQPVPGVEVGASLYDAATDFWTWGGGATTAEDGTYTVQGLAGGTYAIGFGSGVDTDIVSEYWQDADGPYEATQIELGAGEDISGIDPIVDRAGSIGGTVVDDAGQPLENVGVSARAVDVPGVDSWYQFGVSTAADGTYDLGGLRAGQYSVQFQPQVDGPNLVGEWWDDAATEATATLVSVVAESETTGIDAALAPGGSITGSVRDRDGFPFAEAFVSVSSADGSFRTFASPLADGSFDVRNLAAGTYLLQFQAWSDAGLLTEWWNNAQSAASATPVTVMAGETAGDIDIVLDEEDGSQLETFTAGLSGTVTDSTGAPLEGVLVNIMAADGMSGDGTYTNAEGVWTFPGMAAGRYAVSFVTFVSGESVTRFWEDGTDLASATVIELARGEQRSSISTVFPKSTAPIVEGSVPQIIGSAMVGSTLSVQTGTWTTGADLAYQWKLNGVTADGATQSTFAVTSAHIGKVVSVAVTGSKPGYASTTFASAGTAPVVGAALSTSVPTITGTAAVGFALTATTGTWTTGAALSLQWLANGSPISGAVDSRLTLTTALKDKQISVKVTGKLAGYATASEVSTRTPKVATAATPKITGTAATGNTLTVTPGTWTASTTFAYQWFADGAPITGATKSTFVPKAAHVAKRISATVTGTKAGYATVTKKAAATPKVTGYTVPKITGTAAVGLALTADRGSWTAGMAITYQWYADGGAISGATGYTFRPTSTQRDKRITVKVTGKQAGFATVTATSAATARVATVATPSISGVYMVGATLTANPKTWTAGTSFSYQWYADGKPISGATRSTLALTSYQKDKQITVTVTGRKSGWSTVARTSSKTPRIAVTVVPTVGGSLVVGSTLTARATGWTASFTYKWYVGGALAASGPKSTFILTKAHIGKSVRVVAVGSRSGYQTLSRSSATTGAVSSGKARPASRDNCPSGYPIKGNQTTRHTSDWIYHVPGGQYYAVTDPEECFATEAAARVWGYRASLR